LFFRRVYELREDNDIKQKTVAEYLGMQPNVYRRYEKGIRELPLSLAIQLAKHYNVSIDYMVELTDEKTPYK